MEKAVFDIPYEFVSAIMPKLHGAEVKLYLILCALGALSGRVRISLSELAERTGLGLRTTAGAIGQLVNGGHVLSHRAAGGSTAASYEIAHFAARAPVNNSEASATPYKSAGDGRRHPATEDLLKAVVQKVNMSMFR